MADQTLIVFVESLYTVLTDAGLTKSAVHFTPRSIPASNASGRGALDGKFVIDIQTRNTKKYRDAPQVRLVHDVTVSFLVKMLPDEHRTISKYVALEEAVLKAIYPRAALSDSHVTYERTSRIVTPTREYVVISILFSIEQDYNFTS